MQDVPYPVAIIGAGPIGLSAALHLLQYGIEPIVLERGHEPGYAMRNWGHVRLFSPWRYNLDTNSVRRLKEVGWSEPNLEECPTGNELIKRYLDPMASLPELRGRIHYGATVNTVGRRDFDKVKTEGRNLSPFELTISSSKGGNYTVVASSVIDASGTWFQPNPLFSGGVFTNEELKKSNTIYYGIPEILGLNRVRYAGKKTLVVGSGHSALNTLRDLVMLQRDTPETRVVWAIRKHLTFDNLNTEVQDELPARGTLNSFVNAAIKAGDIELISSFRTRHLEEGENGELKVSGFSGNATRTFSVDEIVVATGFRPDLAMLREVRLNVDSWLECPTALAPLIDPNLHSCGTVHPHGARELSHPEQGFYIVGMKSYGRAPTFLMATGYEQARSVAAAIAGDWEAAEQVKLSLPATGVCSNDGVNTEACC